jgi:hypothetical protein
LGGGVDTEVEVPAEGFDGRSEHGRSGQRGTGAEYAAAQHAAAGMRAEPFVLLGQAAVGGDVRGHPCRRHVRPDGAARSIG